MVLKLSRLRSLMSPQRWLVVAVAALVLTAYGLSATEDRWETALLDVASQRGPLPEDEWVSVIGVDRASLDKLGRWPLSRDVYATLIDRLSAARAKTIVLAIPLADVQSDPGLAVLRRMKGLLAAAASGAPLGPVERRLADLVEQSEELLDVDAQLVRSLARAGNVLLVAGYRAATPTDPPIPPLPPHLRKSAPAVSGVLWPTVADGVLPAAPFVLSALGTGHAAVFPDRDGVVRREALWINHGAQALPSVAWLAALRAQGRNPPDLNGRPGSPLVLGGREVIPDEAGRVRPRPVRHASGASVRVESLQDVLSGKVPAERWAGRTVFVGLTATGLDPATVPTLDRPGAVDVVRLAQVSASLLTGQVVNRPVWAGYLGWILAVLAVVATGFMPTGQAAG
ncbi:MAG: CHASE2 domain-containing protein, partial [Rhodoferax sp.]|nr:CHASE2 domain-containing protein [Rhodoferax sp.]